MIRLVMGSSKMTTIAVPIRAPQRFFFFKIKEIVFLDTLILKIYFLLIKINNFRGDLSGIPAKKSAYR